MTELDRAVEELEEMEDTYEQHIEKYGFDAKAVELQATMGDLEYTVEYLEEQEQI